MSEETENPEHYSFGDKGDIVAEVKDIFNPTWSSNEAFYHDDNNVRESSGKFHDNEVFYFNEELEIGFAMRHSNYPLINFY